MAKVALLIGVSEYQPSLNPLPGTARDVEAVKRVLQHPEIGSFTEVKTLLNPDPLAMQEAIESLFANRNKDDLVLLFFSGHGLKDEAGKLYFATRITRKNDRNELIRSTAVPASFIHEIMSYSRSKRQVAILDCCFSGAFAEGLLAKDDGSVDIKNQLGGEGRAILTSSTATQYSFEQQGEALSVYSRYLVEGVETGAADLDKDGVISIEEVHEYAKKKVQEAAPAMKPEIYSVKEGYKIHLAHAPIGDPKLKYRQEVEYWASNNQVTSTSIGRVALDELRDCLEVSPEDAATIEAEVLKPHRERQEKLQRYEQVLHKMMQREYPLSDKIRGELKRLQQVLGLRNEDIAPIEARIVAQIPPASFPELATVSRQASSISLSKNATATKSLDNNDNNIVAPPRNKLPKILSTAVSVLTRNFELLIGTSIATALIFYFLVISQPKSPKLPLPITASTASSPAPIAANNFKTQADDKLLNKRDYDGAVKDYTLYLQSNPRDLAALNSRGRAYLGLKQYKEALADFHQAISFNSAENSYYYNRGLSYLGLKQYKEALADFNHIETETNNIDFGVNEEGKFYYSRGFTLSSLGNKQKAIADYQKAAALYRQQGNIRGYQFILNKIKELQ